MVIISTSAVATIIQAVSAASMVEVSAAARRRRGQSKQLQRAASLHEMIVPP
jgi:hypothetical protein